MCGASANLGKLLLLDTRTGDVRLGQAQDNMPAAPAAPEGVPAGIWGDGLLRWMEEWVRRLQAGWYEVGDIGVDRHKAQGVVLFPVVEPNMAMAVTRGLQVNRGGWPGIQAGLSSASSLHWQQTTFCKGMWARGCIEARLWWLT